MMDWYSGLDKEDFIVPKDEDLLDVFPLLNAWQQWGMSGSQSFGWPMRLEPLKRTDLPDEKNHQKASLGKANDQVSLHESENPNDFSMAGGWPKDSWCGNAMAYDHPYFHFNDLMKNDHMDDIFLSSLLKEDPSASENDDVKSSHLCSDTTQFCSIPADGNSADLIFNLPSVSGVIQSTESSQDVKTGHVATSNVSNNSTSTGLTDRHVPKVLHPSYESSSNQRCGSSLNGGEVSLEEAVLNDFGVTLTQLSKSTRLCFRDSLYRLAQNSTKQTLLPGQVNDPAPDDLQEMDIDDERISSGEPAKADSETNTIDRAVENFVFKKVDVNTQDLLPSMSATKSKCEAFDETKGTKNISFSPLEIFEYLPT